MTPAGTAVQHMLSWDLPPYLLAGLAVAAAPAALASSVLHAPAQVLTPQGLPQHPPAVSVGITVAH